MSPDPQPSAFAETSPDLLLAAAIAFELGPFARRLGVEPPSFAIAHAVHDDRRVSLLSTGMGRPGDAAFDAAVRELRPAAVINVGIAGALDLSQAAGSTWLVEEWRQPTVPYDVAATADPSLNADLETALDAAGVRFGRARAVMVDHPLHDVAERDRIRAGSGAHLVEMEGAAWAGIAATHGVPFGAIRVVSDHANRSLPGAKPEGGGRRAWLLRDDGTLRRRRVAWAFLISGAWLRPRHHLSEMKAAGGQFREAMRALECVAGALFPESRSPLEKL